MHSFVHIIYITLEFLYFEVETLLQGDNNYFFKGTFLNIKYVLSTGAVCARRHKFRCVFPRWLFALHLLAHLLVCQPSPVELGGSDDPVRAADPSAAGGIRHLQSGTLTTLT